MSVCCFHEWLYVLPAVRAASAAAARAMAVPVLIAVAVAALLASPGLTDNTASSTFSADCCSNRTGQKMPGE
jgi:uncharacterized lipoprotein YmbA